MSLPRERRLAFRYSVALPVELVLENGAVHSIETSHISSQGVQFKCDSWLADEIEPRGIQHHAIEHIHLKLVATLPVAEGTRLYARCRVVTARRLSQDEYLVGLGFVSFESGSQKILEQFIQNLNSQESS